MTAAGARGPLAFGAIGLALAALGWVQEPARFYAAWLGAFVLLGAWPLGSMALLLAHALTGGRWGLALRPALRTGVCALPLLLPAAVPFAIGLPSLYAWARPDGQAIGNHFYLNVPFFALRGTLYLAGWLVLAVVVLRAATLARIAPAGLFLLAVTVSFAAVDTTMSLDPHFVSSVYGMLTAAGMGLLALSVAVLLSVARTGETGVRADFGKLLLALSMLWIYLDFMQLLIIWQSDLASESPWYLARSRGFWGAMRGLIVVGHFVVPCCLLLSPRLQRSPRALAGLAALLIAMEVLRTWWTVLPALGEEIGWADVACVLGVGGTALGFATWTSRAVRHV
jgi:hypothetical protein